MQTEGPLCMVHHLNKVTSLISKRRYMVSLFPVERLKGDATEIRWKIRAFFGKYQRPVLKLKFKKSTGFRCSMMVGQMYDSTREEVLLE